MIILLTGAQKTGKTTLINHYEETLPSIATIPEAARELINKYPTKVSSGGFQDMIYELQIERERDMFKQINSLMSPVKVAILDRSILDVIVYAKFLSKKLPNSGYTVRKEWIRYVKSRPYDHIFLCDLKDVNFDRSMSMFWKDNPEEMRERLHELYISTFNELGLRYTLLSGSIEQRIETINTIIERGSYSESQRSIWDTERSAHPFALRRALF